MIFLIDLHKTAATSAQFLQHSAPGSFQYNWTNLLNPRISENFEEHQKEKSAKLKEFSKDSGYVLTKIDNISEI